MMETDPREEPSALLSSLEFYAQTAGHIDYFRQLMDRDRRYHRLCSSGKRPSDSEKMNIDHIVFQRLLESDPFHVVDLERFVNRYPSLRGEQIAAHVWHESEYWHGSMFYVGDELS